MTSFGNGLIIVRTGGEPLSLGTVYYIPSKHINLMSCSRLEKNGATTSIVYGHCRLYHRADNNTLLVIVTRRKVGRLFVGRIQLPRRMMSASMRTVTKLQPPRAVSQGSVSVCHKRMAHVSPDIVTRMMIDRRYGVTTMESGENCNFCIEIDQ